MGYLKDAVKGVGWMTAFRASTRVMAYIKIAVLARLLVPEQFGIYGIASLILAFLETLTETGINVFFIQGEGKIKDYINTAWVLSIIRGLIISLVIVISAPLVAGFFNEPQAVNIIYLMALVPFARAFINPSEVKFKKNLNFRGEFLFRSSIFLLDSVVAVALAFLLKSPSSLVYGMAAGAVLEVMLSFALFKPVPKFRFSLEKAKRIVKRGKWVLISKSTNLAFKEGDDVFVGKMLDTSSLGIYQIAYKISTLPLTEIGQVVNSVTFPVYSKIANDTDRLKRAYLRVISAIFVATLPLGLVFYFFPEFVIKLLLGPNWLDAAEVLKVLAAFGVLRALTSTTNAIYLSKRKQEYGAYVSAVSFIGMAITAIPFIRSYGVIGAGYAAIAGLLVGVAVDLYFLVSIFSNRNE